MAFIPRRCAAGIKYLDPKELGHVNCGAKEKCLADVVSRKKNPKDQD